jgi:hypothetical protein
MNEFSEALDDSGASLDTLDVIEQTHRRIASGYEKMITLASRGVM